jgi:hypothetical protein
MIISSFKNKLLSKQINFVPIVVHTIVIIIIRENFIFLRLVRELPSQGRKAERILRYPSLLVILAKKVHKVFFYDASTKLIYFVEWIRSIEIIFDLAITVKYQVCIDVIEIHRSQVRVLCSRRVRLDTL